MDKWRCCKCQQPAAIPSDESVCPSCKEPKCGDCILNTNAGLLKGCSLTPNSLSVKSF
jgi:hypothetical protein